ncbi:MAG: phosphate acetyltransferase [Silicimonas sp.]|nr:phosphate acetyltransferase [Silicimonas sp.]
MSVIDDIAAASKRASPHIVLSEGDDPRIIQAAGRAARDRLARLTLLGTSEVGDDVAVIDPATSGNLTDYADAFYELRQHKGVSHEAALAAVTDPLGYAAMMVRLGDADGTIGGATHTTSDVVRTALQIIGRAKGVNVVSSYFLMLIEDGTRPVVFADCGLVLQPSEEELASIAIASSHSLTAMTGLVPKVAMLSFSTKGSVPQGAHESLGRIARAIELVHDRAPDLTIDGELQFDAALLPQIAERKAPGSPVAGSANVFVFPSLSAGNIGYKIAERIGGAVALGPILQGLAKPANDLSRGCSSDDVYQMIAITGAQAAALS